MSTRSTTQTSKKTKTVGDVWKKATTVTPSDLVDTKIHLTLRLDAKLYRDILIARKAAGDKSITATIERLLRAQLATALDMPKFQFEILRALRNLLVHSSVQDAVLSEVVTAAAKKGVQKKLSRDYEILRDDLNRVTRLIPGDETDSAQAERAAS